MSRVAAYLALWNSLDAPDMEARAVETTGPHIHFKDPFNEVFDRDGFIVVVQHSVEMINGLKFDVHHEAWDGEQGFLHWTMSGQLRQSGRSVELRGVSLIRLDAEGRVIDHVDHWDAGEQLYAQVPVLGWGIKMVKRRLSAV